jgi:hypothetical protein
MKYNTMEYIYSSGNNPYTITDNIINDKVPHRFSSLYDTNVPNYDSNNSDLKQDFVKKQQMSARMIAPSIATKYIT